MKIYGRVQLIAGINLIAYLAALYFSTGVHTGVLSWMIIN